MLSLLSATSAVQLLTALPFKFPRCHISPLGN